MSEKVSTDLILDTLKGWVEERQPISPELWLESAAKLNVLVGEEMAQLAEKEFKLAQYASEQALVSPKQPSVAIKMLCASNPLSLEIALLKGKIKRVEESIRISKLQARMSSEEAKGFH